MYVCLCKRVREAELERAVAEGAQRFAEVSRALGVGRQCGRCARHARELIAALAAEPEGRESAAA